MGLFKELCFTALMMLAECISTLTRCGLVYVAEIPHKDKKSKHKISPQLLQETKPQKPPSKIDTLSLRKFTHFLGHSCKCTEIVRLPQPRARNGTITQIIPDSPVLSRLQSNPVSEGQPVPITLSVPLRGKQKKTPNFPFRSSYCLSTWEKHHINA